MKYFLAITITAFLLGSLSIAANSEDSRGVNDFEMDKDLVNQLYRESLTEAKVDNYTSSGIMVNPQLVILTPTRLRLSNDYFTVPYSKSISNLTAFRVEGGASLVKIWGFDFLLLGGVGYTYKESLQTVDSKSGKTHSDLIKLHWIPLSIGPQLTYRIPGFSYVRPVVGASVGAHWLYQSGNLDGIEQGFWIPFYQTSAGLVFFEGTKRETQWFGGVEAKLSSHKGFGSTQEFDGWSVDVGASLRL